MYDMYPEWGPARNRPDSPHSHDAQQRALQAALDLRDGRRDGLRDGDFERPDDN